MATKLNFDINHNVQPPIFVLATRNGTKIGTIPSENIAFKDSLSSYSELSFSVHKEINGIKCNLWEDITDFKLVWCKEWNLWFEAYVEIDEADETLKNVSLISLGEAELSQAYLYDIQINTEDDIARDDYKPTVLYDSTDKEASLLDRISEKIPHYSYVHIDPSISGIQRTFSFDNITIYDAFQEISEEINCLFIIECSTGSDGKLKREISVYDLESYCVDCGHRGDFTEVCPECSSSNILEGYGEDTGIFISVDNLADNINYSTDNQSVKNCFKLKAGDDLMTATLVNCNPNGSGYIWYFSDDMKKDMSGSEYTGENLLKSSGLNLENSRPDVNNISILSTTVIDDESVPTKKYREISYVFASPIISSASSCGVKYYTNMLFDSYDIFEIDKPYVFSFYAKCDNALEFNQSLILRFGTSDIVTIDRVDLPVLTSDWQRFEVVFTPKSEITNFVFQPFTDMSEGESLEMCLSSAKLEMGTVATSWEPNLVTKLIEYDKLYKYYQNEYQIDLSEYSDSSDSEDGDSSDLVSKYAQVVNRYSPYTSDTIPLLPATITGYPELMTTYYNTIDLSMLLEHKLMPASATLPETSAAQELSRLSSGISPVSVLNINSASEPTATSTIQMMARVFVDPRYQIKVSETYLSDVISDTLGGHRQWTGKFTITNYSDEEDTATSQSVVTVRVNGNYENYLKQRIERTLDSKIDDTYGIVALFESSDSEFKNEIKKYCLQSLRTFYDACDACLNILIEQGATNESSWTDKGSTTFDDVYNLYQSYRDRSIWLAEEIQIRDNDISFITGLYDSKGGLVSSGVQDVLETYMVYIQNELNMEEFIGEKLWNELAAYRRETPYSNENYISDGLDNAELFKRALEFIKNAQKEIFRSATLQHSITATLKNLLVMEEFAPIVKYLSVGNWIRVGIDDKVYKLRLIDYEMTFDNVDNLNVTFSDVKKTSDGISDVESILNKASSMAASYGAVTRQASKGQKGNAKLSDWVNEGLSLTNMKIVGDAENQNIEWDSNGLICREYIPELNSYDDRQLKIINKGLYITDDNWETAKAGIGNFLYYDPETKQTHEAYGVIADTLVGNLILSKDVGIYNPEGSISLNKYGFTMTIDTNVEEEDRQSFKIRTTNDWEHYNDVIYFDSDGNANFTGKITATSLFIGGSSPDNSVGNYVNNLIKSAPSTYTQATDPSLDANKTISIGDFWINTNNNEIFYWDGSSWSSTNTGTSALREEINNLSNVSADLANSINRNYQNSIQYTNELVKGYRDSIEKYMQYNDEDGLVLGSSDGFKTVIDSQQISFQEQGATVAYINNQQLNIEDAVIRSTLYLGHYKFAPHDNDDDDGFSIIWDPTGHTA